MRMPGFHTESSLSSQIGLYCRVAVSGQLTSGQGLAMQQFLPRSLSRFFWTKKCCVVGRIPACVTFQVPPPFIADCTCQGGAPVCTPRIFENV